MGAARRWPDALLIGLASSMRTFSGPAVLAARDRVPGRARRLLLIAGAGELAFDKAPAAMDRVSAPSLLARVLAGAYGGSSIAGPAGLLAGAAGAAAGSFATFRARSLAVQATGLPDPIVAAGEDIVAYAGATLATEDEESVDASVASDFLAGVAAGLAGTALMTIAQGAEFALSDAEPSSAPADAAENLKRRAGWGAISRSQKPAANQAMHWLYGTSWGIPYGLLARRLPVAPELSGPLFGLVVWTAGLAGQPAAGVAEPPWERTARSLASEALFHAVYGVGAAAALRALAPRPR